MFLIGSRDCIGESDQLLLLLLLLLLFDDENGIGLALYEMVHSYYVLMGAASNALQYQM